MYMYTGLKDLTRLSETDLSAEELKDEVRRLTKLNKKDRIQLEPLREPFDADHQPDEVSADSVFMS